MWSFLFFYYSTRQDDKKENFSSLCDSSCPAIRCQFSCLKGRKQQNQKDVTYWRCLPDERFWDCWCPRMRTEELVSWIHQKTFSQMVIKPPGKSGRLERRSSRCKEQEHLSGEVHSRGQSAKARGWQASHSKESWVKNKITEPEIESANGEGWFSYGRCKDGQAIQAPL